MVTLPSGFVAAKSPCTAMKSEGEAAHEGTTPALSGVSNGMNPPEG